MSMQRLRSRLSHATPIEHAADRNWAFAEPVLKGDGFYFQQRSGRLDLRRLSRIDLERVVREVDVDTLQMHLENLCYSDISEGDLAFASDAQVLQVLKLSQLTVEYLLHVQDTLAENVDAAAHEARGLKEELHASEQRKIAQDSKIQRVEMEVKQLRRSVAAYEALLSEARVLHTGDLAGLKALEDKPTSLGLLIVNGLGDCVKLFGLELESSVAELKRRVRQSTTLVSPASKLRLLFEGREMADASTLREEGLREGAQVLALPARDRSPEPAPEPAKAPAPVPAPARDDVVVTREVPVALDEVTRQLYQRQDSWRAAQEQDMQRLEAALERLTTKQASSSSRGYAGSNAGPLEDDIDDEMQEENDELRRENIRLTQELAALKDRQQPRYPSDEPRLTRDASTMSRGLGEELLTDEQGDMLARFYEAMPSKDRPSDLEQTIDREIAEASGIGADALGASIRLRSQYEDRIGALRDPHLFRTSDVDFDASLTRFEESKDGDVKDVQASMNRTAETADVSL
uniref:Ubiquitin-like domain-containing protein n=1 Tax=Pinguiococcus pyrenoidosus TaxID=172671 RepID=A0A7R9YCD3_9STRA|mmetsp:Transcript_19040/g.72009  ORF Transcript_19040/g.72009 Transcript_19040/m.72009 type:complete len:519 (+) Transcript_19040:48-1604(+)|eukprot:scaffold764_cov248-Pinguiococcus_pyrenoidosus.AAC.33